MASLLFGCRTHKQKTDIHRPAWPLHIGYDLFFHLSAQFGVFLL